MLLLGIDLGTSSVKVSVMDAETHACLSSATYPETESAIIAPHPGWAEQSPEQWWADTKQAILKCHASGTYDPQHIGAIGIAYQMHGLVLVDKNEQVLRNAIIWCDSRAVETGAQAFKEMGEAFCLQHLLNSPGNFTAAKLAWVKQQEPSVYERINKILLPGDFLALRLTGEATTTVSALSEGIFWDFKRNELSSELLAYYGFSKELFPEIRPLFSEHGRLRENMAAELSLKPGIPITYKAGDQLNNAFGLNVLQPGEVAATAGTSGVIYGVTDKAGFDEASRINSFAHVNHTPEEPRIGVLLCINGAGIFNRWIRNMTGAQDSYASLNDAAANIPAGSEGLFMLPFGNGAERIFNNRIIGAYMLGLDLNIHGKAHLVRAAQEGIAYAFRYGLDIMREQGMSPGIIRAGHTNMFLSPVFARSFVDATGIPVELFEQDGSQGAALGAGVGAQVYSTPADAFRIRKPLQLIAPSDSAPASERYFRWKELLEGQLSGMQ